MRIRSITADETYSLRQHILRPNHPIEACRFPEDNDRKSAHFGCYVSNKLIGIVSVFNVPESDCLNDDVLEDKKSWQVRAMATHESVRGRGYASQLLKSVEEHAQLNSGCLIWCNARTSAVGFYLKQGYKVSGDEFEIVGVGPHFRLKKQI